MDKHPLSQIESLTSSHSTSLPTREGQGGGSSIPAREGQGGGSASYKTASPDRYALLRAYARENRRHATLAERHLWEHLRSGVLGVEFLRQHVVGDYIADFASRHGGLIIEVDGGYHSEPRQAEDDAVRMSHLAQMGYHILRFSNEEVLYDIENVLQQIENDLYD